MLSAAFPDDLIDISDFTNDAFPLNISLSVCIPDEQPVRSREYGRDFSDEKLAFSINATESVGGLLLSSDVTLAQGEFLRGFSSGHEAALGQVGDDDQCAAFAHHAAESFVAAATWAIKNPHLWRA
jgi:hypothetical protein